MSVRVLFGFLATLCSLFLLCCVSLSSDDSVHIYSLKEVSIAAYGKPLHIQIPFQSPYIVYEALLPVCNTECHQHRLVHAVLQPKSSQIQLITAHMFNL